MQEETPIAKKVIERNLATPTQETQEEYYNQVSIIKGLSAENDLLKIELRFRGYTYSFFKKQWVKVRKPVMNDYGLGNFMSCLQAVGDLTNFSNYNEKDIPKLVMLFVSTNYPTFRIYADEFELDPKDFNIVFTTLYSYSLSVYRNAKGAGHRNTVRGVLSEDVLNKALGNSEGDGKKKKGLFSFLRRNKGVGE